MDTFITYLAWISFYYILLCILFEIIFHLVAKGREKMGFFRYLSLVLSQPLLCLDLVVEIILNKIYKENKLK